jgi:hypothetical protein
MDDRWKELREALAKGTARPWFDDGHVTNDGSVVMSEPAGFVSVAHLPLSEHVEEHSENAALIATAVNAAADLLAERDALAARVAELEAALMPLAAIADAFDLTEERDEQAVHAWHMLDANRKPITRRLIVGDARRARAALKGRP